MFFFVPFVPAALSLWRFRFGSLTTSSLAYLSSQIFAQEGLRTLAFAMKQIPPEVYGEWFQRFKLASVATEGRAKLIDSLADEIERDLFLVGATAIEDKLQEGVPEAITTMQRVCHVVLTRGGGDGTPLQFAWCLGKK
mgnify:CR=1 FL=1